MDKTKLDKRRDNLLELGTSLFAYYTGKELHIDQLNLVAESTDKEKILAMELLSSTMLKGREYTNYCQNSRSITRIKKK